MHTGDAQGSLAHHAGEVRVVTDSRRRPRLKRLTPEERERVQAISDALHYCGKCTCHLEGTCDWCKMDAARDDSE